VQGHSNQDSVTTRDTNVKDHMKKEILLLFAAMSAITRAQSILLAAVDIECLKGYKTILEKCLDTGNLLRLMSRNVLHFANV